MSHAPSATLKRRHQALRQELIARDLDALVVTARPNVLYLTNFTGSAALVVITADSLFFVTDSRYATALRDSRGAPGECPGLDLVLVEDSYDETLVQSIARLTPGPARHSPAAGVRVGIEAAHLSVSRFNWLKAALAPSQPVGLIATEGVVERLRVVKDEYELGVFRDAGRMLSAVADRIVSDVRRGVSERDLARIIDQRILEAGFERPAFDTIVASGPNAALPHAKPGGRTIGECDLVVLDFGGVYASYCVDLTRTVVIGKADGRTKEIYGAVRDAHDRAIGAVAPGRSRFDIDAAARNTLVSYGLGDAFGHGTGHGLGVEVHEAPRISRRTAGADTADEAVLAGMVFTIEPGAYLPGWGGVRIEDDVLVTGDGVEVLTTSSTELLEI